MSLLDDLRAAAEAVPQSHKPVGAELGDIVGALVGLVEHGKDFLEACKNDLQARAAGEPATAVDELLSPDEFAEQQAQAPQSSPAAPAAPKTIEQLEAERAALDQQIQTAQAQEQRTTTSVEPVTDPTAPSGDVSGRGSGEGS